MSVPRSIEQFLRRHEVSYSTFVHPAAFTAQEESAAAHVRGREWAKTVVCLAGGQPMLAVVPAPFDVDLDALRRLTRRQDLRLAAEDEFAALYPEVEPGAMPPLGPLYRQQVIIDDHLRDNAEIVFAGGTHTDAIRMQYRDFERLVHPTIGHFARFHRTGPIAH